MSLVIAIRDKDRFVFGSDKQASTGNNKFHTATKVWEVEQLPGAIIGAVGTCRATQVIQYGNIIDFNDIRKTGIDTSYIINSFIPCLTEALTNAGVKCTTISEDEKTPVVFLPNSFLFAYQDKAWMIYHDLSVSEVEDYIAIGSGADAANGALFATPEKNPFDRIVTSIDAASETTLFVDNGVDIVATKYYPTDEKQIKKALGIIDIKPAAPAVAKPPQKKKKSTKKVKKTE